MRKLALGAPSSNADSDWIVQALRQIEEASYIDELLPEIVPDDHTFTGAITFEGAVTFDGLATFNGNGFFDVDAAGIVTAKQISLIGSTTPSVLFTPSSGATKFAQIFQQANTLVIADAGVANRISINLANGDTTLGNLALSGSTQPALYLSPTSGATKTAQISQLGNILKITDAGVADRITIDLATGDITCGSVTGVIFTGATIQTTFQVVANTGTLTLANGLNSNISNTGGGRLRITGPTAGFSIGGFSFNIPGLCLRIYNTTAQQMTIVNEDASSTAAFRIKTLTGADVVLRAGTSHATFIYDATDARWILESTN